MLKKHAFCFWYSVSHRCRDSDSFVLSLSVKQMIDHFTNVRNSWLLSREYFQCFKLRIVFCSWRGAQDGRGVEKGNTMCAASKEHAQWTHCNNSATKATTGRGRRREPSPGKGKLIIIKCAPLISFARFIHMKTKQAEF